MPRGVEHYTTGWVDQSGGSGEEREGGYEHFG